ncbi:hypothetical protein B0J13DRAFT_291478 [Dactylonectria estremocensis]|uniref:Uncharacterized protein n=1 Tax=Dactylonectria estremocensis TaxID=1079267 RepID=A0A9P9D0W1_9HYPO|nr:hypothetical protein B0J13DRAFT_291478 [Dactylonectria estremocensis]
MTNCTSGSPSMSVLTYLNLFYLTVAISGVSPLNDESSCWKTLAATHLLWSYRAYSAVIGPRTARWGNVTLPSDVLL